MTSISSLWTTRTATVVVLLTLAACAVTALAGFDGHPAGPTLALMLSIVVATGGFLLRRRSR